jgi:hypothetical protein
MKTKTARFNKDKTKTRQLLYKKTVI